MRELWKDKVFTSTLYEFRCTCGEIQTTEAESIGEAVEIVESFGWLAYKYKKEVAVLCEPCKHKAMQDAMRKL